MLIQAVTWKNMGEMQKTNGQNYKFKFMLYKNVTYTDLNAVISHTEFYLKMHSLSLMLRRVFITM